jgi:hypothetical protein
MWKRIWNILDECFLGQDSLFNGIMTFIYLFSPSPVVRPGLMLEAQESIAGAILLWLVTLNWTKARRIDLILL